MTTLAGPPGQDYCLVSVKHEGNPKGETVKIADIDSYVTQPEVKAAKEHGRIIMLFPDIFGPFFVNTQLIMDFWASHGYLVCSPDYFRGDPLSKHMKDGAIPPDFDRQAWRTKHWTFAEENVPKWVEAVKEKYGSPGTKYATVGYCFGASWVLNQCAADLVSAGAVAHPTALTDDHIKNCKKPILFSCAETDGAFPPESRHKAEAILAEKKAHYHFQLFSGVAHGFGTKADMKDENARWAKEESASGILRWFDRWCN